jgi:hypothetical protein
MANAHVWSHLPPTGRSSSVKARLLARTGRATLTVQQEALPYRYVSVEGPVVVEPTRSGDGYDLAAVPRGTSAPRRAPSTPRPTPGFDMVTVRLRPERWFTVDYGKTGL